MADPKEKNWWERNVEDAWEEQAKREHDMLESNPVEQLRSDVGYGIQRGGYEFAKGLVVGLVDLAKLASNIQRGDPATYAKIWDITKTVAKELYISKFGTPEEVMDQNNRIVAAMKAVGGHIIDEMKKDWDKASREGRQAALISKWATEGVLNVASFFVGAGEVKAAANAARAAEAAEALEAASVVAKCPKIAAAERLATEEAAKMAKAAEEAAKAAKAKAAEDAAKLAEQGAGAKKAIPKVDPPRGGPNQFDLHEYRWPGKSDYVSYEKKGSEIAIDYVKRVENPPGSAGSMVAEAIKAGGNQRPTAISASNILQKTPKSNEVIEKTLLDAVEALGGKATKVEKGVDAGKHWVKISIEYP